MLLGLFKVLIVNAASKNPRARPIRVASGGHHPVVSELVVFESENHGELQIPSAFHPNRCKYFFRELLFFGRRPVIGHGISEGFFAQIAIKIFLHPIKRI